MKRKVKLSTGTRWFVGMLFGGITIFGTTGCDADVQAVLVQGLNQAANTLVNAAFLSITPDGEDAQ